MNVFSLRNKIIAGVAAIIILAACGWCIRRDGVKAGELGEKIAATAEKAKQLEAALAAANESADVETQKLVAKDSDYRAARSKVETKGDSVIADGKRVELPSVVAALVKADSLSIQVPPTVVKEAAKDTLQNLLVGTLNDHVDLLEQKKEPRFGTKTGVVIGVVGTTVAVYITYRVIKIIAAVAKR
ncbi:MAG: hypothetical protein ACJ8AK_02970 [Gemmatimonadaceae bacterium]